MAFFNLPNKKRSLHGKNQKISSPFVSITKCHKISSMRELPRVLHKTNRQNRKEKERKYILQKREGKKDRPSPFQNVKTKKKREQMVYAPKKTSFRFVENKTRQQFVLLSLKKEKNGKQNTKKKESVCFSGYGHFFVCPYICLSKPMTGNTICLHPRV